MKGIVFITKKLGICVNRTEFKGFILQKGMMFMSKDLAEKIFITEKDEIESDIIVSYVTEDYIAGVWHYTSSKTWNKKFLFCRPEFSFLAANIKELFELDLRNVEDLIKNRPENLYTDDGFKITDVVAGDKCNDGGEYGFYSLFRKTDIGGLYECSSDTTCDFDDCGKGFDCFMWLTPEKVTELENESLENPITLKKHSVRRVSVRLIKKLMEKSDELS